MCSSDPLSAGPAAARERSSRVRRELEMSIHNRGPHFYTGTFSQWLVRPLPANDAAASSVTTTGYQLANDYGPPETVPWTIDIGVCYEFMAPSDHMLWGDEMFHASFKYSVQGDYILQ